MDANAREYNERQRRIRVYSRSFAADSGVTLLEMIIVVSIIALMAAIIFPSAAAGLDSLKLSAAADSIASLFNQALNRAERRQQAVEITISAKSNSLKLRSSEPGFQRSLELPAGIAIRAVYPALPQEEEERPRQFLLYPGGTVPRIGVEIAGGSERRLVSVDPITGVPRVERPAEEKQ